MRGAAIIILLLAGAVMAQGGPTLTVGDVAYENVIVKKEYPRSFFIQHDGGTAFIDRSQLSEEQIEQLLGSSSGNPDVKPKADSEGAGEDYKEAKRLLKGEDEENNWKRGVELMQKAAEAGDGHAMVYLATPGGWPEVGGGEADSRAWLDKAFATGDPEVMVNAASRLSESSSNPKGAERLGMTKEEMQAKAIEALRAGCKENVLEAYRDLAIMLGRGTGVEKNEKESEELMAEFKRRAGQRVARGSMAARVNLMAGLQMSGAEDADSEVLRLANEVLEQSDYPGHYTVAALFGARSVEGKDPQNAEGISRALAWLKDRNAEKNDKGIAGLITSYESRLAKASSEPDGP